MFSFEKDFEEFITERFIEFYNNKESKKFIIKAKSDKEERNKPTCDYHCIESESKREMAIEIKRLFSKEKTQIKKIENWVQKYIEKPLKGIIKGEYFLLIKGFESPFKYNKKKNKKLIKDIREEIRSLVDPGEFYNLKCQAGISLLRMNEEGSGITAWPIDLSTADEAEIVRVIDASLKKFNNEERINIILLVELSSEARRTEIASIIANLKIGVEPTRFNTEPRQFNLINGIYHIGLHRDTVIAQVFPESKIFESEFFNPSDFMEAPKFRQFIIKYLL